MAGAAPRPVSNSNRRRASQLICPLDGLSEVETFGSLDDDRNLWRCSWWEDYQGGLGCVNKGGLGTN
jgi:hypothetical protein